MGMTSHAYRHKQHEADRVANENTRHSGEFKRAFDAATLAGLRGSIDRQARKFRQHRGQAYAAHTAK